MKAKYGIFNEDTYHFDKSGFLMGVISIGVVVIIQKDRIGQNRFSQTIANRL